jgi:hypothetical protein
LRENKKTMRKIILVNGLLAGIIVSAMVVISIPLQTQGVITMDNGMLIGYASMLIALSTIFFGIKTYRDQYENGTISFWQATRIGLSIALVAAVVYAVTWEIYFRFKGEEFMTYYAACYVDKMKSHGATEAEISTARKEMIAWNEFYRNPFIRFGMTLTEILPVGIFVSLVSAAILRKREILPA